MTERSGDDSAAKRWERAEGLFHAAAERPAGEWEAFLQEACGEDAALRAQVLAMLAIDATDHQLLDGGVAPAAQAVLGSPDAVPSGQRFGPYRVTGLLGEGGMGVVYRARREDLASEAAIKVLRDATLSPARRARFAFEQRALAQLNHPSIARLYDADTLADGTPWIAMELVEGVPVNEYCDARSLPIEARLKLLRETCEAVQHAHGQAILHRDLKPSNILVRADGRVKLLDFGIARSLDETDGPVNTTRTGMRLMTPAYAAPEQVRGGPLGVHTDVYSLGVVLYELLTGRLPFDLAGRTPSEAATILTEQPVRRPSAVVRERGERVLRRDSWNDLDVLCLTAMHRDPARRYRTVDAFMRDLDHYLADEPLEARGDSFRYVAGKFVRRNAAVVAAVAFALVALVAVTVFYTARLTASRNEALAAAKRAERNQDFVESLLRGDDEGGISDTLRVITLLEQSLKNLMARSPDEVAQLAYVERSLGSAYLGQDQLERADSLLSSAYLHALRLPPPADNELVRSLLALAALRSAQERHAEADSLSRRSLELARRRLRPADPLIAEAASMLGSVLVAKGEYDSAVTALLDAVRLSSAPGGSEPLQAASLTELANAYYYLGRYAESDSLNRLMLARDRRLKGDRHPNVAIDLVNLADIAIGRGRYAEAESRLREALGIMRGWFGEDHSETASCLTNLAKVLVYQERLEEAKVLLRDAIRIQERVGGPWNTELAQSLGSVADIALWRDQYQEATRDFTRSLQIYRHAYGAHHQSVGIMLGNLGSVDLQRGDYPAAERHFRAALEAYRGAVPPGNHNVAIAHVKLGRALLRQQRHAEAEKETREGYEVLVPDLEPTNSYLRAARTDLAAEYTALRREGEAARFRAELADTASSRR